MRLLTKKIRSKIAMLCFTMMLLSLWQALESSGGLFGAIHNERETRFEIVKVEEFVPFSCKRFLPAITNLLGMESGEPVI